MSLLRHPLFGAAFLLALAAPSTSVAAVGVGDFASDVWPVLEQHCVECHGQKQSYSNLRLDSQEAISRGGELGKVLDPGNAEKSELYRRAALPPDDLDFMPVDGEPLEPEELDLIKAWIAAGADFGSWRQQ